MFRNRDGVVASENQEGSVSSHREFYRKALISFLVIIVVGAVVGTAVSILVH